MAGTVYIKLDQKVQIMKHDVTVADLGTVFCADRNVQNFVRRLRIHKFPKENSKNPKRVIISVVHVIELIQEKYPGCNVISLGEPDVVVEVVKAENKKGLFIRFKILMVCCICFFGTAFTIIAFHNDVGITAVFSAFYENVTGQPSNGFTVLEITYTIGLAAGMCIFFNHIGGRRLTKDPTPIEVEMHIYEDEVNKALIATAEREGKEMDVD